MNDRGNSDIGGWIVTIIMLVAFWPVGIFLLFRQLMGNGSSAGRSRKRHPYDIEQEGRSSFVEQNFGSQSGSYNQQYEYHYTNSDLKGKQSTSARKGYTTPPQKSAGGSGRSSKSASATGTTSGRIMTWVGAGVAALFGIGGISQLLEYLSWGGLRYAWSELFAIFGFCAAGLVVMYAGLSRTRKGRRFQKYLNLIGRQKSVRVETLASTMGRPIRKVYDDLDEMLDRGVLPVGYLDHANGLLVLSDEGVKEAPKPQPKTPEEEAREDNAILREIRAVNDDIPDPVMSRKIDRIEEITGKILDYQRKNPGKDSELRSFLDYYLPTTLKILRAYAQLDAQGIEGENIRSAKERIEGMMDKVVEGFEKQLDKLFQAETLDITSDVQVLEQMLRKDGLSGGDGMTLGG